MSDPCTARTSLLTSIARLSLPNSEMVASAPSTTSIRIRKMKNRITAVEQPKNPQKILRAKASRNVSRTSARVAVPRMARGVSKLVAIDGPYEHFLQRAPGARDGFDLAFFRAQQIHGPVRALPVFKMEFHVPVLRSEGGGCLPQLVHQPVRRPFRFHTIAAA